MAIRQLSPQKKREAEASRKEVLAKHKGKAPNILTPPEIDEITLTMAEALGFYDPTP